MGQSLASMAMKQLLLICAVVALVADKKPLIQEEYVAARDDLKESQSGDPRPTRYKAARLGKEGCCGKGCNGCLIFTHDPAYAKARELFRAGKIGQKLETDMREDLSAEPSKALP